MRTTQHQCWRRQSFQLVYANVMDIKTGLQTYTRSIFISDVFNRNWNSFVTNLDEKKLDKKELKQFTDMHKYKIHKSIRSIDLIIYQG